MLTINLLTPARQRRRVTTLLLTAGAVTVSIALVAGLAVWSYALLTRVAGLRRDLDTATQEVAQLRLSARHVQELSRDAETLRQHRALLEQLPAPQIPASQILETIRSVIPRDVQLTTLTLGTSDMTLEGFTLSYPSVARFMVELEDSGSLRHVDLSMSQSGIVAEHEVVKFQITGDLIVPHPVTSQTETTP